MVMGLVCWDMNLQRELSYPTGVVVHQGAPVPLLHMEAEHRTR